MKARMPAGFGRPDMNSLMRQAQKMQEDMKAKQAELEAAEYTGSASGDAPDAPVPQAGIPRQSHRQGYRADL